MGNFDNEQIRKKYGVDPKKIIVFRAVDPYPGLDEMR